MQQGSQTSLRVVKGYSGILNTIRVGAEDSVLVLIWAGTRWPFDLCQEPQGSSRVSIGETGLLLMCKGNIGFPTSRRRGIGPDLEMMWGTQAPSRVMAGDSGFLSSGDWNLGSLLICINVVKLSFQVSRGNLGLFSRRCWGKGLISLRQESSGLSHVAVGSLGFHKTADRRGRERFHTTGRPAPTRQGRARTNPTGARGVPTLPRGRGHGQRGLVGCSPWGR